MPRPAPALAHGRRLRHVHAALARGAGPPPGPSAVGSESELPVVGVIDMENKDGTIYAGDASDSDTIELHALAGTADVVYTGAASIEEVDPELLAQMSGVLLRRCPFGEAQLALLPKLKVILRMGAGYDNVDTQACADAGVIACNCPDAWVEEVADSTACLLVALIRRTFDLANMVAGDATGKSWTRQADLQQRGITRIRGMRLGIVGMGRIGTAVSQRARAFGFDLSFHDPGIPAGAEKGFGGMTRYTSFTDLVANVDAVTFHCPLTDGPVVPGGPEGTRGMLNLDTLPGPDHPGLFVVNCARGGIATEEAIIQGLADGRLRGVALDSVDTEPTVSTALLEAQQGGAPLLITPHAAFYSDEAFEEMRGLAAAEVGRILSGEPAQYQVNAHEF